MTRPRSRSVAVTVGVCLLVVLDAAVVAISLIAWQGVQRGHLTETEAVAFGLFGGGAAVGIVGLLVVLAANVRGLNDPLAAAGLARSGFVLAGLRTTVVFVIAVATPVIAAASGGIGFVELFIPVLALVDALFGLVIAGQTARRLRHAA